MSVTLSKFAIIITLAFLLLFITPFAPLKNQTQSALADAAQIRQEIQTKNSQNIQEKIAQIKQLYQQKKYQEIVKIISQIIHNDRISIEQLSILYVERANAYLELQQPELAKDDFSYALWLGGLDKNNRAAIIAKRAEILFQTQKIQKAKEEILRASKIDPYNPDIIQIQAQIENNQNPRKIIKLLEIAQNNQNPQDFQSKLKLAKAWIKYQKLDKASLLLQEILKQKPQHQEASKILLDIQPKNDRNPKNNIKLIPIEKTIEIRRKKNQTQVNNKNYPQQINLKDNKYFQAIERCLEQKNFVEQDNINILYNKGLHDKFNSIQYVYDKNHDQDQISKKDLSQKNDFDVCQLDYKRGNEDSKENIEGDIIGDIEIDIVHNQILEYQPRKMQGVQKAQEVQKVQEVQAGYPKQQEQQKNIAYEWNKVTTFQYAKNRGNSNYKLRKITIEASGIKTSGIKTSGVKASEIEASRIKASGIKKK